MRRVSWAPALLLVFSASMPAHAQLLTEDRFLEDAMANHPDIAAAESAVAAAGGVRRQAAIIDNPGLSWEREDPDIAPRQDTWLLDWRLPFDGRRHRMAAADAGIAAADSGLEATRLGVRLELRSLFSAWYIAEEREAVFEANLDRTRRLAGWLRARAEEGEAAGVEARRLDLEVESMERAAVSARADARAARAAVAVWSPRATVDVYPARPPLAPPPAAAAVGGRPDVMVLTHRVTEAEAQNALRKRVAEPPTLSLGWTDIGDGGRSFAGPVIGVAWPLPVFDRSQGRREVASAEVTRAKFDLVAAARRAQQEANGALASYTELHGLVLRGPLAEEDGVVEAVFAAFEAGEASLTDVLDTWRATVDVQMARLETIARALSAERELEAALGRPIGAGEES